MSFNALTLYPAVDYVAEVVPTPTAEFDFSPDAVPVVNGKHLIALADSYQSRRQMTLKQRAPIFDAKQGRYSKRKSSCSIVWPNVDAVTGKTEFNTIRIEAELHPSFADIVQLRSFATQLLSMPNMDNFWLQGALP